MVNADLGPITATIEHANPEIDIVVCGTCMDYSPASLASNSRVPRLEEVRRWRPAVREVL